jgi:hypothetical protein
MEFVEEIALCPNDTTRLPNYAAHYINSLAVCQGGAENFFAKSLWRRMANDSAITPRYQTGHPRGGRKLALTTTYFNALKYAESV